MQFEAGWKRGLPKGPVAIWHRDEPGIMKDLVLQSVLFVSMFLTLVCSSPAGLLKLSCLWLR